MDAERARDRSPSRKARRNARLRERRATDPEWRAKQNAIAAARYARHRKMTLDAIYERDRGMCHLCYQPVLREDAEADHLIPSSQGGSDEPDNLALAHAVCNRRRRDLTIQRAREILGVS